MGSFARKLKREAGVRQANHHDQLRKVLRALQSAALVLKQYADESNWTLTEGDAGLPIWLGEGNGPELAQKVLGVKKNEKAVQLHDAQGPSVQESNP